MNTLASDKVCWPATMNAFWMTSSRTLARAFVIAAGLLGVFARAAEEAEPLPPAEPLEDVRRDATVLAVERVMPAVVNIATRTWTERENPYERWLRDFYGYRREPQARYSRGSGVVIDEEGYVLTNSHVVGDADDIWVQFYGEAEEAVPATRVQLSTTKDVALLKLQPKRPRRFHAVKFARDDDLLLGETVIALGNPFGLGGSISRGILSSKSRRAPEILREGESLDIADWLQTDAAINPGNSGGPLVNLRGELIGLNVAVLSPGYSQGIGFAIPIKQVNQALSEMLSGESIGGYWFGARMKPATRPLTVQSVQSGSPAAQAGLLPDDVVLEVNGRPSGSLIEFNRVLNEARDEREITLRVRRAGSSRIAKLQLIEERVFFNNALLRQRAGFTLREYAAGLVIDSVEPDSPAEAGRLRPGYVLASVDDQPVDSVVGLAKLMYSRPRGERLKLGVVLSERSGFFVRRYSATAWVRLR